MIIENTVTGLKQDINIKKDWFTNYQYQEDEIKFIFEDSEENFLILDKLLLDLIKRDKSLLFFQQIYSIYTNSNNKVLFIDGIGNILKSKELKPVFIYLNSIISAIYKK